MSRNIRKCLYYFLSELIMYWGIVENKNFGRGSDFVEIYVVFPSTYSHCVLQFFTLL